MRYYHAGKPLIRFEEAQERLMAAVQPLERTEQATLSACLHRVLAETITAPFDVPPFNRAAMDGYAVRAEDIVGATPDRPIALRVIGRVFAGDPIPSWEVEAGTCAQIATGAPLPPGADCVVPFEDTERDGDWVKVLKSHPHHANINERGLDLRAGQTVLTEGTLLTPSLVGVLAALGLATVRVYARPQVAIVPTGTELARPGTPLKEGQIYDINTYTLAALAQQHGCEPLLMDIVPDEEKALRQALSHALAEADMVVFSAGSAVGERDLLPRLLGEVGTLLFHGIAVRPGRPTLAATVNGKLVVNLPGFPASCLTMAYVLLVPAWRKLAHLPEWRPVTVAAQLAHEVRSPEGLRQFLTVRVQNGIAVSAYKESAAITSLADADGYIVIPEEVTLLPAGTPVTVHLF